MTDTSLPYRPNVGIALFNAAGLVFAGTAVNAGPEVVTADHAWQMPQGGIDADEDIEVAARRELWEETGIADVSVLAITQEWWPYEFPPMAAGRTSSRPSAARRSAGRRCASRATSAPSTSRAHRRAAWSNSPPGPGCRWPPCPTG